jgi:hypothetical protein
VSKSIKAIENSVVSSRIHQRIGQLIAALIAEKDIRSERGLGRISGLTNTVIRAWMHQRTDLLLLKLIQLAYSIGWSMTELMAYAEGEQDPKVLIELKRNSGSHLRKYELSAEKDKDLIAFLQQSERFSTPVSITSKNLSEDEIDSAEQDILPESLFRQRLKLLLLNSMAVKGILEKDLLEKTDISESLLRAVQEPEKQFKFGLDHLEQLALHLYQVQKWQGYLPIFKQPLTPYEDVSSLHADLFVDLKFD